MVYKPGDIIVPNNHEISDYVAMSIEKISLMPGGESLKRIGLRSVLTCELRRQVTDGTDDALGPGTVTQRRPEVDLEMGHDRLDGQTPHARGQARNPSRPGRDRASGRD